MVLNLLFPNFLFLILLIIILSSIGDDMFFVFDGGGVVEDELWLLFGGEVHDAFELLGVVQDGYGDDCLFY